MAGPRALSPLSLLSLLSPLSLLSLLSPLSLSRPVVSFEACARRMHGTADSAGSAAALSLRRLERSGERGRGKAGRGGDLVS
eukprot:4946656-Pleurochrysis_carterae.AAC.1